MDYREYLKQHRDPKHLPRILEQVIDSGESIHQLGYIHRDLKPDNIMITLRPLTATIIDFDLSHLRGAMTSCQVRGTSGYYPARPTLNDGSTTWDVWAIEAIILESDMRPGEYYGVAGDRAAQAKAEEHCKDKETSPMLRVLLSKTMLRAEVGTMEGLHFIKK